jgi:hypothetical protein
LRTSFAEIELAVMARFLSIGALVFCFGTAVADSGGPYLGVPDLKSSEEPPTFAIPAEAKPLRFYLSHFPQPRINKQLQEPDSYDWQPCKDYYATVTSLGHVSGRQILAVRYISDRRIDQGLDYAETLLLLARQYDTEPTPHLCTPILYVTAGTSVYNITAEYFAPERTGAVLVTRWGEGTGASRDYIYVRGSERGFERFTPKRTTK